MLQPQNSSPAARRHVRCFKQNLFRYYGWLALLSVGLLMASAYCSPQTISWQILTSWVGGTFLFVNAIHKQKVDELKLFADLFTRFNARFAELSKAMNAISEAHDRVLGVEEREALNKYFDLCGEEFLFWQEELIHPHAWDTWRKGMAGFFAKEHIAKIWREELRHDCYYGLTATELEKK